MFFHSKNLNTNNVLTLLLILTINTPLLATEQQEIQSSLINVSDLYSKSLDLSKQEKPVVNKKRKLTLEVQKPTRDQMLSLALQQVIKLPIDKIDKRTALDRLFLKKMELFCGEENKNQSLLHTINNTDTVFGTIALAKQLAEPTYNIPLLNNIQTIIQELLNNTALTNEIQKQLDIIKETEPYLFSYFQENNAINEELINKVYWSNRFNYLNSNEWTLELGVRLSALGNLFSVIVIPSALASTLAATKQIQQGLAQEKPVPFLQAFGTSLKNLIDPRLSAYGNEGVEGCKADIVNKFKAVQELSEKFRASPQEERSQITQQLQEENLKFVGSLFNIIPQTAGDVGHLVNTAHGTPKYVAIGVIGALLGLQAYNTYTALQDTILKQNIYNHLQTKMIAVASYIHALQELAHIIISNNVSDLIQNSEKLNSLLTPELSSLSRDCQKLLKLLNHTTFIGDASVFSLTGRILKAHKLLQQVKEELIPACTIAGQIDAYLSTAKLYNKHKDSQARFCFVNFDEISKKPYAKADNFWNPFIDAHSVVTNSIYLGIENPNNILLTGPNTGGKSTVIKGLLINILLAQTLTIAPAKTLTITPFAYLNCYLNITDDLTAGTSLFKAEVLRAKTLINAIRSLQEKEFSLTIIDEIFSGTSPQEGEEAAVQFAQELSIANNSLCAIATHFPRLTQELPTHSFKNYNVTVFKDDAGNWVRPFTLQEGASFVTIAMDLLREEGIFNS